MEDCKHEWEKLGQRTRRFMPWSIPEITGIVYICSKCLEKKEISV